MGWLQKINLKTLKPRLPIIIILAAAFLLRLIDILKVGDFCWDELFSYTFSGLGLRESFNFWLLETNPPLHMLILKLWFCIFPHNEFFARLPSLIFSVANIGVIYLIGKKFFNQKIALLAALALTLMPYHIFLSGYARGYSLLLFLVTCSLYYFFKILRAENTKKDFTILAVINLLMLFTHLTAVLVIMAQFIILLKYLPTFKKWFLYHIPVAILFLAWIIPSLASKFTSTESFGSAWFFNFTDKWQTIIIPLRFLFFGPTLVWLSSLVMILFIYAMIREIINIKKTKHLDPLFFVLLVFFCLPILNAAILNLWNIKFIAVSLPAGALLFAYLISRQIKNIVWGIIAILAMSTTGIVCCYLIFPLSDWHALDKTVEQNIINKQSTVIIATNFVDQLLFERYIHAPAQAEFFFDTGLTPNKKDLVTKNYLRYERSFEEIDTWFKDKQIDKYQTVFVLQEDTFGVDMVKYMDGSGKYQEKKELEIHTEDLRRLYIYEKN